MFKAPPATIGKRLEWVVTATVPVLVAGFFAGWLRIEGDPASAIPIVAIGVRLRYLFFPLMYGGFRLALLGEIFIVAGAAGLAGAGQATDLLAAGLGLIQLATGLVLCRQWRDSERDAI